jgi:hypothetical protein
MAGQDWGVEPVRELAQLDECFVKFGAEEIELVLGLRWVELDPISRQPELNPDGHQALLRAVVQVVFDPLALGVARRRDSPLGSPQIVE